MFDGFLFVLILIVRSVGYILLTPSELSLSLSFVYFRPLILLSIALTYNSLDFQCCLYDDDDTSCLPTKYVVVLKVPMIVVLSLLSYFSDWDPL